LIKNMGLTKKSLDIHEFIDEIKLMVAECDLLRNSCHLYYGKVTFCFQKGRMTHVKNKEDIK